MLEGLIASADMSSSLMLADAVGKIMSYFVIFAGFSLVIFFHELGHFMAAKLCDVKVDKFAVGFGRELFGFSKGETRYSFNILPLGGYVKMMGQEDFAVDKSGEWKVKDDPRAFTHKPISQRMFIVSAGVVMNLICAAALFMVVFMIGMESPSAEIGEVQAGMPAEKAGLRVGDKIVEVNGKNITDQNDLKAAVVLSDPDANMVIIYERKDRETGEVRRESVTLRPEMAPGQNILKIGVAPPMSTEVALSLPEPSLPPEQRLRVYDVINTVNGEKVETYWQIVRKLSDLRGQWATLSVSRPIAKAGQEGEPEEFEDIEIKHRAHLIFVPGGSIEVESGHLLGLVPRRRITNVFSGQRGELAGMKKGDVIARWGDQIAPQLGEIGESRRQNRETDIRVTVHRPGEGEQQLTVRPKVNGIDWFGNKEPLVGITLSGQENDMLVVADIVEEVTEGIATPAAKLKEVMPRGSLITKLNDQPVTTWMELTEKFIELAGNTVTLTWSYQGRPEQSGEIYIPQTLGTTFDLPSSATVLSINGIVRKEATVNGKHVPLSADNWHGSREILRDLIGQTATVVYQSSLDREPRVAEFLVTEEMLDTWVQRIKYQVDDMVTMPQTTMIRETNPAKAMLIGVRKTYHFIEQVYLTMQRMIITRSMGLDQISGPVGILELGSKFAAAGPTVLMYFLALISANLAVINFLPLPIVDGGLFIFLIIEKIKGSPINLKVQVATQLIGLALIIGIFLFVTIQDIQKLATG